MASSQPHCHGTVVSPTSPCLAKHLAWPTGTCWCGRAGSQLAGLLLTYCVVRRELEEVGGQDGRREEPQENEAAHRRVPHVQVICIRDTESQLSGLPPDHSSGPQLSWTHRLSPSLSLSLSISVFPSLSLPHSLLLITPSGSWAVRQDPFTRS